MKNNALDEWIILLRQSYMQVDIDEHYCKLINAANSMLRKGLIEIDEWHCHIKTAGDWLVSAVESERSIPEG